MPMICENVLFSKITIVTCSHTGLCPNLDPHCVPDDGGNGPTDVVDGNGAAVGAVGLAGVDGAVPSGPAGGGTQAASSSTSARPTRARRVIPPEPFCVEDVACRAQSGQ